MSYDFSLHLVGQGESIDDVLAREQDELELDAAEIVASLLALNPRLELVEFGPFIELTDLQHGAQITIRRTTLSVSLPYHHVGEEAELAMNAAWDYLEVCAEVTGYAVYDPQLGRVVDLGLDRVESTASYVGVIETMPAMMSQVRRELERRSHVEHLPEGRRPWWKFWN